MSEISQRLHHKCGEITHYARQMDEYLPAFAITVAVDVNLYCGRIEHLSSFPSDVDVSNRTEKAITRDTHLFQICDIFLDIDLYSADFISFLAFPKTISTLWAQKSVSYYITLSFSLSQVYSIEREKKIQLMCV